jgi:hypothetical protein
MRALLQLLLSMGSVPFLTIYPGGGQFPPPGKEFAHPPLKPFLPPKCEAELLTIAVRIAVDLLDNEIMALCPYIASSTAIVCVIHIVLHRVFRNSDRFHKNNPIKCWFQEE